jgi:hypothetical protein
MSIARSALGELPLSSDPPAASKGKPPPNRSITPNSDAVQQPEAR